MRVVRAIKEEHGNQHQGGQAQQREHDCRMLEPLVVNPHGGEHRNKSGNSPSQLSQQEEIARVVSLFRDHRRRAEHHY